MLKDLIRSELAKRLLERVDFRNIYLIIFICALTTQGIYAYSPYSPYMSEVADKRIPVTKEVWEGLSDLKSPGETFAQLLEEMIEHEKKLRLFLDMEKIEREGNFVEMPL